MRRWSWFVVGPAAIVGIVVVMAIGGTAVQLLWNWLLPPLFGWSLITFWQAIGLLALCRILFGGLGRSGSSGSRFRRMSGRMRERMAERWAAMTPEERERWRHDMRGRCGFEPPPSTAGAGESKGP
jgi:uncharacterized membrane protein